MKHKHGTQNKSEKRFDSDIPPERMVTMKEAAEMIGCSYSALFKNYRYGGRFTKIKKIKNLVYFDRDEVNAAISGQWIKPLQIKDGDSAPIETKPEIFAKLLSDPTKDTISITFEVSKLKCVGLQLLLSTKGMTIDTWLRAAIDKELEGFEPLFREKLKG